jgi:hypothetical protein
MQCACATLPSAKCPAVQKFQNYLINGTVIGGKKKEKKREIGRKMCVLIFSTTFV